MPSYFTRESAQALLPTIVPLLLEIQALRQEQIALARPSTEPRDRVKSNGHIGPNAGAAEHEELRHIVERLEARLRKITALGVLVKDLDSGLIDFPWLRDGNEVYLCWKLGEGERIQWWHEIERGFAGRQPLDPAL